MSHYQEKGLLTEKRLYQKKEIVVQLLSSEPKKQQ